MSNADDSGAKPDSGLPPKKRGRKSEVKATRDEPEDESVNEEEQDPVKKSKRKQSPDKQRGIMVGSDAPLRRRDTIRSTKRYSPPPPEPSKSRRGKRTSFPSTMSVSKSALSSSQDVIVASANRSNASASIVDAKKGRFSTGKEAKTYDLDMVRDSDGKKMLITLPDGTTYRVDAALVGNSGKVAKRVIGDTDDDDEDEGNGIASLIGQDSKDDDDYKPRKKVKASEVKKKTPVRKSAAAVAKVMSGMKTTATLPSGKGSITIEAPVKTADGKMTTTIATKLDTGKTKVISVTTPKSVTLTPAFKSPPKKMYGAQTRFIEDLPELNDCIETPVEVSSDAKLQLLPNKIQIIHTDLPLKYMSNPSIGFDSKPTVYAFRQIISPVNSSASLGQFSCLICPKRPSIPPNNSAMSAAVALSKTQPGVFKNETDLRNHYNSIHELMSEVTKANFPDDVIFVCLPKQSLDDFARDESKEITVNQSCQFCDGEILSTLTQMKQHYIEKHRNEVVLIEQETILKMTEGVYCFSCNDKSFNNFRDLNDHLRSEHQLTSYPCKSCIFFTNNATRLKSHFKAKHMITGSSGHSSVHCSECSYCNGVLMGVERMNRHIMSTHCILTASGEYSCISCLEVAGTPDTLVHHTTKCPALMGRMTEKVDEELLLEDPSFIDTKCFLCDKQFDSPAKCRLHLDHLHTKWVKKETETTGQTSETDKNKEVMKVSQLPPVSRLEEVGVKADHGFYCSICETVISVYPLFYLHMHNVHGRRKRYQCKITSCSAVFASPSELKQHLLVNNHPQKSVMEDPLGCICCHFCDAYFKSRAEFEEHHLSDEHNNKIPSASDSKSYSTGKNEARNFKCKSCHTWFGLTDSFVHHMENETHKHPCPYCGIDFALPSSRRTHIQSHHSDKTDVCEICSVKQGNKERLVAHLVSHGLVFECNHCMKKFYQREQLNNHAESHKPAIECLWTGCGKRVLPTHLSAHIKQHRVEKNSKCTICNKVFSSASLLESHMDVHAKAEMNARAIIASSKEASGAISVNISSGVTAKKTSKSKGKKNVAVTEVLLRVPDSLADQQQISDEMPPGLKAMCTSCNQLLNTQAEILGHKCKVGSSGGNRTSSSASTLNTSSDAETASAVMSLSMPVSITSVAKKAVSRNKSPVKGKKSEPPVVQQQVQGPVQAQATSFEPQQIIITTSNESAAAVNSLTTTIAGQNVILLQNEDGSVVQLDINQLLTSLSSTSEQEGNLPPVVVSSSQPVNVCSATTSAVQSVLDTSVGITLTEEQLNQMVAQQQQSSGLVSNAPVTGLQLVSTEGLTGNHQVIFMNEDGSYSLDASNSSSFPLVSEAVSESIL